jgi:hypothetical protein
MAAPTLTRLFANLHGELGFRTLAWRFSVILNPSQPSGYVQVVARQTRGSCADSLRSVFGIVATSFRTDRVIVLDPASPFREYAQSG